MIVTELAKAGDPTSRELLEDVGEWLGLGLANLAAALDPGKFVIGGGLCDAGELLVGAGPEGLRAEPDRPRLPPRGRRSNWRPWDRTPGLIGAADLSRVSSRMHTHSVPA